MRFQCFKAYKVCISWNSKEMIESTCTVQQWQYYLNFMLVFRYIEASLNVGGHAFSSRSQFLPVPPSPLPVFFVTFHKSSETRRCFVSFRFVSSKRKYIVGMCPRYVATIYSLIIYDKQHVILRSINRSTFKSVRFQASPSVETSIFTTYLGQ